MFEHSVMTPGRRSALMGSAITLTVLGLTASALPASSSPTPSANAPADSTAPARIAVDPRPTVVRELAVPSTDRQAAAGRSKAGPVVVAELPPTSTDGYALVGVTWAAGTADARTRIEVSTRSGGTWSPYDALEAESDPTDVEGTDGRGGTSPLWVGDADGIAVRVTSASGQAPDDLQVATIEPARTGTATRAKSKSGSGGSGGSGARIAGSPAFPEMPDVIRRREWGADPNLGDDCFAPIYGRSARAVVVHHTVNSNDYSRSDSAAIVRSILAYHTQGQGWCDIGYNFLVDRFGRIYEGRKGGMRLPVRGAHAGDYNTNTVGVSMIGDYDRVQPTPALKNALVRLIGWRLGTSYTPIYGRTRIYDRRLPHILAHGNVMSTACPGRFGRELLPALRTRVHDYLSRYQSPIQAHADRLGRSTTGRVFVGEKRAGKGFATTFEQGRMLSKPGLGAHWLSGRMLGAFQNLGGRYRLGFPRTDAQRMPTGVTRMVFEHGRLYKRGFGHPRLLSGRVLLRWFKLDGAAGPLGAPTSSISTTSSAESARFQNGRITWRKVDNTVIVERS